MSWGVSVNKVHAEEVLDELDEKFDSLYSEAHDEVKAQFENAKSSLERLMEGIKSSELVSVSLNGHSRAADPNSAHDATAVSVSAVG